jgi:hypothetical protein
MASPYLLVPRAEIRPVRGKYGMGSFRDYCEQTACVDRLLAEFNNVMVPSTQAVLQASRDATAPTQQQKPWSAKKPEILQIWKNLRQDTPIIMTPVVEKPDSPTSTGNSSYGEDGVRITGSWNFITAVMARLKELVWYENPQQKLRLIFRGIDRNRGSRPDRQSFVFYCNLEGRSKGKAGRPTTTVTPPAA